MARRLSRGEVERFFASLSSRSRLKLFAAIFFLLAPVGVLSTTRLIADRPPWTIVAHAPVHKTPILCGRSAVTVLGAGIAEAPHPPPGGLRCGFRPW